MSDFKAKMHQIRGGEGREGENLQVQHPYWQNPGAGPAAQQTKPDKTHNN